MSSDLKVLSGDELKQWWTDWTSIWEEHYEQMTLPVTQTLISWSGVRSATSILEVACATGAGAKLCNFQKPKNAKLTCIDISASMVEKTKQKVNDPSVTAIVSNAEELPFEDNSFDSYYASYCLHLTTDPDKMLKEASRVVKKGGIASFSMWGRKENCRQCTILDPVTSSLGISLTSGPRRSPFHIGADEAQLRKRALAAGFSKCVTFYQMQPIPLLDGKPITELLLAPPNNQKMLQTYPAEKVEELKTKLTQMIDEDIKNGVPLTMEALILVAYK